MLFSSLTFVVLFLPLTIFVYFLLRSTRSRNIFLLAASLLFYAWGEPKFILLIVLSIFLNYSAGRLLLYAKSVPLNAQLILALAIVSNLGFLFFFKYFNFVMLNANYLQTLFGRPASAITEVVLPIGISFYTFQSISYLIDVYRDRSLVQKNILKLGLYIAMFPQLIAGPIVRYRDVRSQIEKRVHSVEEVSSGFRRFILGLAKKVIIADTMGQVADSVFSLNINNVGMLIGWVGLIAYSLQIYFDFSGYSDMAIGLGRIFGFRFLENFNYPYISKSITEFWRRWHISLSNWFKDYLYVPLGGNRIGSRRTYLNLIVVFAFTGIWHGANWTFLVWGLWHGAFIVIEKITNMHDYKGDNYVVKALMHTYCLAIVTIGWIFFRSESLGVASQYLLMLFGHEPAGLKVVYPIGYLLNTKVIVVFIIALIGSTPAFPRLIDRFINRERGLLPRNIAFISLFVLSYVTLSNAAYNPFIYFQF